MSEAGAQGRFRRYRSTAVRARSSVHAPALEPPGPSETSSREGPGSSKTGGGAMDSLISTVHWEISASTTSSHSRIFEISGSAGPGAAGGVCEAAFAAETGAAGNGSRAAGPAPDPKRVSVRPQGAAREDLWYAGRACRGIPCSQIERHASAPTDRMIARRNQKWRGRDTGRIRSIGIGQGPYRSTARTRSATAATPAARALLSVRGGCPARPPVITGRHGLLTGYGFHSAYQTRLSGCGTAPPRRGGGGGKERGARLFSPSG